ncbi:flavohemoprotein [Gluconobacter thailandicus F149-1 = NBRC 100600]|uniref:nitric oxide dioxygenase n=1 Tax=Gluconobacter thailandicus NBRC 3257 TaxID=1381097 RepID=A0ABQ0IVA9_GLUTH|nr:globin domain-containing protein [Gluconobacter thailandicus]KXV52049.1 dihydropteridine reductase [Gluconobacter thailandicus]GAC86583.1 flavohemoprotein [Gluconobacter thailandicus NBRC 3255]GAD26144.1 flavohemoprotein [Gluconobacter thailandicus NBRC 3257]GAN92313.1 flavohemoprotein [Gluconobacter thailandicus F149-1 = NBRC 100600]GBR58875.1 flavohemoprotein [Gluconobacter thailandicus F149-1 = NBRC 100600]
MSSSDRSLTPDVIAIIKATIPALEAHGLDITTEMYRRLLADPAIAEMFDPTHQSKGTQPRALAMAVLAYAKNIDNLGVLGGAVERIAQKHVSLEILPEHYPHVATALIGAIQHVLGNAATPEILDAWGRAYWALADILIGREHQLYDTSTQAEGGWTGWRSFKITQAHRECENVTTLELKPVDGKSVIRAVPGQYLGVDLDIPDHGQTRRNYSITSKPGHDGYTISVRHVPNGVASAWLNSADSVGHEIRLSPPAGEFVLPEKIETPVAFICAGIGITPMIGMIASLSARTNTTPVSVIQIAHSKEAAPFAKKLSELTDASGNITLHTRLTSIDGRPDAGWITSHLPKNAACYLCGPTGFMREMVQSLPKAGIPAERLRYETFGPDTGVTD